MKTHLTAKPGPLKITLPNKERLAAEKAYKTYWDSYLNGDEQSFMALIDDDYQLIGTSETEICHNKEEAREYFKASYAEIGGKLDFRNRVIESLEVDGMVLFNEMAETWLLMNGEWTFYAKLRISTWLRQTTGGWKVIQQHGSIPDQKVEEGETAAVKQISKEVFELRSAIIHRTRELEAKNRELEIEAALEKVRSAALAMKKPDDMVDVCHVISDQLELLGVTGIRNVQTVILEDTKEAYQNYLYFAAYKKGIVEKIVAEDNPLVLAMVREIRKSPRAFFTGVTQGKELQTFRVYRKKDKQFPDPLLDKTKALHYFFYSIGAGALGLSTYQPLDKEGLEVFKKFHKVFTFAYQRFIDLEKAIAQAREAQIEAALERVRARTMAMQSSDELAETSLLLFQQFKELGEKAEQVSIAIVNDKSKEISVSATLQGSKLEEIFKMKIDEQQPVFKKIYRAWKSNKKSAKIEIKGKELKEYNRWRNKLGKTTFYSTDKNAPSRWIINLATFSNGMLSFSSHEPASDETIQLLERFAAVFDGTYTRFLDLKKAEAQAREAQIEAALERVRSRSMAMHKSEELADLSLELVKQVQALGVPTWFCAFNIYDDDPQGSVEWGSNGEGTFPKYRTPREGVFLRYYEAGQRGETLFINEIAPEECPAHYEYLCTLHGVGEQLLKMKDAGIPFPESQVDHVAFFKYGYILFITYDPVHEAHDIFKRFAKVFEQTYTRFLDLKKAESQAREAQIEAALERVRSRSLAMHSADELSDVVIAIVEKLKDLGVVLDANGVVLCTYFQKSKDVLHWIASPDFSFAGSYLLPYFDHPIFNDAWQSKESGEEYFSKSYSVEEKNSFFEHAFEHTDYKKFPEEFKQWILQNDKHTLSFAWQKNSAILIPSNTGVMPSEDDVVILKRFAKVFEQAYVRFMDLQRAEAQAREAQIEAALERIRGQVTAMKASSELLDIVVSMRKEFVNLGHEAHYFWHMLWAPDKYEKAMTSGDGTRIGMIMELPRHIHGDIPLLADWEKSNETFVVYAMDAETAVDYVNKMITLGDFKQVDPQAPSLDDVRRMGGLTFIMARTMHGEIGYSLPGSVPNPPTKDLNILVRFAGAFDLAHRRFLDLQMAEKQARETQIELALEKVRNRTMAMQHSDELPEAAYQLFLEIQNLGLPVASAGYCIWESIDKKSATAFISSIGELQKPFSLPTKGVGYDFYGPMQNGEKFHVEEIRGLEANKKHYAFMRTLPVFGDVMDEIMKAGFEIPEYQVFHVAYFSQGYLMFITRESVPHAHDIFKRCANVFEQTYTRFLDLQTKEEQTAKLAAEKQRLEKTLHDLRQTQTQLVHAEKMASLGELTAGIAHEIQNPLNFVNNFSELNAELIEEANQEMVEGNLEDVKEILSDIKDNEQKINHHGKRAEGIVKGMLQHSRTSSGEKEPTDLNVLADEYLRLSYHGLRAKDKSFNADFKMEFDESLPKVNVVPQDIGRVLLNLINNAFYAVSKKAQEAQETYKPEVVVKTKNMGKNVIITVQDNGNGIPGDVLDKIFQPFFTTKPTGEGTGLGLSLSYDIVTKGHNGHLEVNTANGTGTEFIVEIPFN